MKTVKGNGVSIGTAIGPVFIYENEVDLSISAKNSFTDSIKKLIDKFKFTQRQTKAILDMRLQKLTSLETDKLIEEHNELLKLIKDLKEILESVERQNSIIKEELNNVSEKYGDERKTEIIPISGNLTLEDMIAEEEMVVTISHNGYIKRLPTTTWRSQNRGGTGMKGANTKQDDYIEHLFTASTHDTMLFFTNEGKCYWLKVHQIPQTSRTSQGRAIVNLIGCNPEEKIQAFVSIKEFNEEKSIVMCTKKGLIKRTNLMLYSKPRKGGIYAIDINEGDELIQAKTISKDQDIILATNNGKAIRFEEHQIRSTGRKTKGVTGIRMSFKNDYVVDMLIIKREGQVFVVSEKGYGKRSNNDEYRCQKRGGKGVFTLKSTDKTGKLVSIMEVVDKDDLMIITDQGTMIRQPISTINIIGRNTQGVRLIKLKEEAKIASVTKVIQEESLEENLNEEEPKDENDPSYKKLLMDAMKTMQKQQQQMSEMMPLIGNNNNNTTNNTTNNFNLNFFLNETCKDALNITDFIDSLRLQLNDLEYTTDNGHVKGITNIFQTALSNMEETKRPMHCTDLKRETLYIKDNDEWQVDEDKEIIKEAVEKVTNKNISNTSKWLEKYPEHADPNSKDFEKYVKMTHNSMGTGEESEKNKILKNIMKEVKLETKRN